MRRPHYLKLHLKRHVWCAGIEICTSCYIVKCWSYQYSHIFYVFWHMHDFICTWIHSQICIYELNNIWTSTIYGRKTVFVKPGFSLPQPSPPHLIPYHWPLSLSFSYSLTHCFSCPFTSLLFHKHLQILPCPSRWHKKTTCTVISLQSQVATLQIQLKEGQEHLACLQHDPQRIEQELQRLQQRFYELCDILQQIGPEGHAQTGDVRGGGMMEKMWVELMSGFKRKRVKVELLRTTLQNLDSHNNLLQVLIWIYYP